MDPLEHHRVHIQRHNKRTKIKEQFIRATKGTSVIVEVERKDWLT